MGTVGGQIQPSNQVKSEHGVEGEGRVCSLRLRYA